MEKIIEHMPEIIGGSVLVMSFLHDFVKFTKNKKDDMYYAKLKKFAGPVLEVLSKIFPKKK